MNLERIGLGPRIANKETALDQKTPITRTIIARNGDFRSATALPLKEIQEKGNQAPLSVTVNCGYEDLSCDFELSQDCHGNLQIATVNFGDFKTVNHHFLEDGQFTSVDIPELNRNIALDENNAIRLNGGTNPDLYIFWHEESQSVNFVTHRHKKNR